MRLDAPRHAHLTYCTNIHPGESWREVRANLERYVVRVKQRVAPDRPFGVGLRLSAQAAEELAEPKTLAAFQEFLATNALYVFTINGFPYGPFHGRRVKEDVYLPDWLDEARLQYTDRLAYLLAALLPGDMALEGSISTAPGAFKARVRAEADAQRMAELMIRHVATLVALNDRYGKLISLAIEPEPYCHMETVAETVTFFERYLFTRTAAQRLSTLSGHGERQCEAALHRHLGVCFDACHMAVEFEDAKAALAAFRAAGIRIGKLQISAGLKVYLTGRDDDTLTALRPFAEGVYLHQVVERSPRGVRRYVDLPHALEVATSQNKAGSEWRIHFHVPLFREHLGPFDNTQDYLRDLLGLVRQTGPAQHLEVETYTWDVLPEEYRREDIVTAVARELSWTLEHLMP